MRYVVQPALLYLSQWEPRLDSPVARALMLGTAMVESNLTELQQHGGGPAVGLWQVEPATHDDIWQNWLAYRPDMHAALRALAVFDPKPDEMRYNLLYACAVARLVYWRDKQPLPPMEAEKLAIAHKRIYNTHLGATDVNKSLYAFAKAIRYVQLPPGVDRPGRHV